MHVYNIYSIHYIVSVCLCICRCIYVSQGKRVGCEGEKKSVIDIPERENWPWCCDCCWPGDRIGRTAHPDMHPLLLYIILYAHTHDYIVHTCIILFITVCASVCVRRAIKLEKNNYTPHNNNIILYTVHFIHLINTCVFIYSCTKLYGEIGLMKIIWEI